MGSIPARGKTLGEKEKYSHSKCRQPESNLVPGGSGNPAMTADMEILRGLENLGAPWDSMVDSRGPTELFRPLVQP